MTEVENTLKLIKGTANLVATDDRCTAMCRYRAELIVKLAEKLLEIPTTVSKHDQHLGSSRE